MIIFPIHLLSSNQGKHDQNQLEFHIVQDQRVSFGCELPLRIFSERLVMCNGNLCRLVQLLLDGLVGHMRDSLSTANTGPGSVLKWYHTGIDSVFSGIGKSLEILRINDRHPGIDRAYPFDALEDLIVPVERFIAFDEL